MKSERSARPVARTTELPVNRRKLVGTAGAVVVAGAFLNSGLTLAQTPVIPVRGGSLTIAAVTAVASLDPLSSTLGSGDAIAYRLMYNTLISLSDSGDVQPELATNWSVSDDELTYTFVLESGITFHDGSAFDAESVVFNFDRYRAEGSTFPNAHKLASIESVVATDTQTVTITLSNRYAPFLVACSQLPMVSPAAVAAQGGSFQTVGGGTGPFTLASWSKGNPAVFARYETYWQVGDDGDSLPYLAGITVDGVFNDANRLESLRTGEFDLNERVEPKDLGDVESNVDFATFKYASATSYVITLNAVAEPFDNLALRQAVSAALDRQTIIDAIGFGTGYTAPMPFPEQAWFYVDEPGPVFDPEVAKAKLAEAGYPDGIEVRLCIINRPIDAEIAALVSGQMAEVGIRANIIVLERPIWVDLWTDRQGEMGIIERGAGIIDPDDQSAFFYVENIANFAGYESEDIQKLVVQANETSDRTERLAVWQEIARIVVEDAVYIFIGAVPKVGAMRVGIEGLTLAGGEMIDVSTAWLAG